MIINPDKAYCFSGHRPHKIDEHNFRLSSWARGAILYSIGEGIDIFITGMSEGWDLICAKEVLELKERYDIKLVCAIPHKNHDKTINSYNMEDYKKIIKKADYVHNVTGIKWFSRCEQIRNEWMVNNSCGQIVCWDGSRGGTFNCIKYADSVGKVRRHVLHPKQVNAEQKNS